MINNFLLSNDDIDFLLNQQEVINAKEKVDKLSSGSIYFTISLNENLREILFKNLGLVLDNINTIPMRWIKGDTQPHIDRGNKSFDKTYLAYLTDSSGHLIIDSESYPITKGNAYVFNEGLLHQTIGTGMEPRLLLGPMSEEGLSVGAGTSISADGATDIVYVQYNAGAGVNQYKINDGGWSTLVFPCSVLNVNGDPANNILKVIFTTDIYLVNNYDYFLCASHGIQFGSTSLNDDGSRPTIVVSATPYPGLIKNGNSSFTSNYNNIYIFNLHVNVSNGVSLDSGAGWFGQAYFGVQKENNYIINCSSNGPISSSDSGGIVGGGAGSEVGGSLFIIGCSSSGLCSGDYSGGITGSYAGRNGGSVICESCWSTGVISGTNAGGIFGHEAANTNGFARAFKCYSFGTISGDNAGGIFGALAGTGASTEAEACYSQGAISGASGVAGTGAGGIYGSAAGSDGGTTIARNCYSSGSIINQSYDNGIFSGGDGGENRQRYNSYVADDNWSDAAANAVLTGTPNPIAGITWVASGGENYPYELNNMGYTPYTLENIVFQDGSPILNQSYSQTILSGDSSIPAIRPSYSYDIYNKSEGNPSSYGTITINDNTGIISTTSGTLPGTYKITIRNTGSYNITLFYLTITKKIIPDVIPNVPICFLEGTPVLTDQGEISIEKIDTTKHTINGEQIVAITESIPDESYLICIEKNSLAYNVPNRRTIISKDHKIMCDKKLVRAEYLIQYIPTIYKIPYNKQKLYNVLLNKYSTMSVNNLIVETMNPNNALAKVYSGNYTTKEKNELIKLLNNITSKERKKSVVSRNMYIA